jgi:hypothetical protein
MLSGMRFCGRYAWEHAAPPAGAWSSPALLGSGAVDWSPSGAVRTRLGLWSPEGAPRPRRHAAGVGGIAVVFAGYLQNLPPSHDDEAAYVLDRYRAGDGDWIQSANGVFAFAVVDEARDRCVLGVDRLGMRPLYYSHDAHGVTFSGTMGAAVPWGRGELEIDYDTLQELMVLGFPLTDRTFLRGVERVAPGTVMELRSARRHVHRYWSLEQLPSLHSQPVEAFVDESQERLRRSLSRILTRAPAPLMCLLSSGYDSRRLLLEASALGGKLAAVTATWPYPGLAGFTIEPGVTAELCRRLGVAHRVVAIPRPGGAVEPRAARLVRDVLLDFQVYGRDHIWAVPLVGSLGTSDPHLNLDGICGDTFFNNPFYSLPRPVWGRWRPEREVLDAIAPDREAGDRLWQGLISRSLSGRIEAALAALPDNPNRLSFFYLLGRTRAIVALLPYGLLDERVESFCPYLDHEVMEHALALDPVPKGEVRLQSLALRRHHPRFDDIPTSHSPASEVPRGYLTPLRHTDPIWLGRFTPGEIRALLPQWRPGARLPPLERRALAFAGVSMLGLAGWGGRWREPQLRDRLQALRGLALLGGADIRPLLRARAQAADRLVRWGLASTQADGRG